MTPYEWAHANRACTDGTGWLLRRRGGVVKLWNACQASPWLVWVLDRLVFEGGATHFRGAQECPECLYLGWSADAIREEWPAELIEALLAERGVR